MGVDEVANRQRLTYCEQLSQIINSRSSLYFYTLIYLILHILSTGCPTLSLSWGIAICQYLFLSGSSPIIVSPCPRVSKSSCCILFKVFTWVSLLLHGFVQIDIWISLNGYLELSKLMH